MPCSEENASTCSSWRNLQKAWAEGTTAAGVPRQHPILPHTLIKQRPKHFCTIPRVYLCVFGLAEGLPTALPCGWAGRGMSLGLSAAPHTPSSHEATSQRGQLWGQSPRPSSAPDTERAGPAAPQRPEQRRAPRGAPSPSTAALSLVSQKPLIAAR